MRNGLAWTDFTRNWRLSAYAVHGFNPYELTGKTAAILEIGELSWGTRRVPWGIISGNLFYPGFLNYENAKVWFVFFNIIALISTSVVVTEYMLKMENKFSFFPLLLVLVLFDFYESIYAGNAGGMVCCCLLMVWCLQDENEIISAFLLSIALTIPQISLIVCLGLLLKKIQVACIFVVSLCGAMDCRSYSDLNKSDGADTGIYKKRGG